eukprot:m.47377 g.47377  ORF g.47377 m.47377 type:complete len:308 (-) comp5975_c0_seq1:1281-2204(-)
MPGSSDCTGIRINYWSSIQQWRRMAVQPALGHANTGAAHGLDRRALAAARCMLDARLCGHALDAALCSVAAAFAAFSASRRSRSRFALADWVAPGVLTTGAAATTGACASVAAGVAIVLLKRALTGEISRGDVGALSSRKGFRLTARGTTGFTAFGTGSELVRTAGSVAGTTAANGLVAAGAGEAWAGGGLKGPAAGMGVGWEVGVNGPGTGTGVACDCGLNGLMIETDGAGTGVACGGGLKGDCISALRCAFALDAGRCGSRAAHTLLRLSDRKTCSRQHETSSTWTENVTASAGSMMQVRTLVRG